MEIGVIIVAAGSSSRLGQPKQLVMHKGKSLLQHTIDEAKKVDPAELIVVVGARREEMDEHIRETKVVYNEHWAQGMGSSIAKGVKSLMGSIDAILILQCDQPSLNSEHLHKLLDEARNNNEIVISEYKNGSGPPCCFSKKYFSELEGLAAEFGARSIVKRYIAEVVKIPFEDGEFDIDTPADLMKLRSQS